MTPEEKLLALLPELNEEEKDRRTREGLADVDAGRTIPHEEILQRPAAGVASSGSLAAANWRISIGNLCVSPNQLRKLLRLFNGRRIYPRQMPQHLPERYEIVRGRHGL